MTEDRPRAGWRRSLSLRARLLLGLIPLLGGIAFFMLQYVPGRLHREAMRAISDKANAVTDITASVLAGAILFDDSLGVIDAMAAARHDPDLRWIVVEDSAGKVLGALDLEEARMASYRDSPASGEIVDDVFRISALVRFDRTVIGRVYLGTSLLGVERSVATSRRDIMMVTGLIFLLGFMGVVVIASFVTQPLQHMVGIVGEIAAGDLSRRVGESSGEEVGKLASAFDSMLDQLEHAYGELHAMNRDLEDRVTRRTAELQRAYDERIVAEQALSESEQRFRTMFESSAVGIVLIDHDHALREVNAAFAEMFRAPREALIGLRAADLIRVDDDQILVRHYFEMMAGKLDRFQCELRCKPLAGPEAWGRAVVSVVRDSAGDPTFAIAMIENITEQKEMAEQLRQAQKLEAVGRLAGGVAHDFNNLLTTINGLTDLMLSDLPETSHLRKDLVEVKKSGERAALLTRQLLAFSRRQVLQPKVLDLNETIGDMAAMLRRLIGEHIELVLSLEPTLPRTKADPGQITQVLMNLAVNSRDAMPVGGRLSIETAAVQADDMMAKRFDAEPGRYAMIKVSDSGHGMDEETLRRVFEPFFTTKEVGRGTGLGLATVYGIVKQSGGGIAVDSAPGLGAVFTILLPAAAASMPAVVPPRTVSFDNGRGTETVLLVEDEAPVRALAARVLRRAGYSVIDCPSAADALRRIEAEPGRIDVVVTDVVMPGMSGPDLVMRLFRLRPDIRVLYMSGYPREELDTMVPTEADFAFIQKPMSPAALAGAVRTLLDSHAVAS
jgi:PAS domain S-box-containing protein